MSNSLQRATHGFLRLHDLVYRKTGGWVGHRVPGMPPSLLLHTVGAKTGQPRTTSLTYARDGGCYLIVASNAGATRYPGWYHNLSNHPECDINIGPKRLGATARQVDPDDSDYPRMWRIVNEQRQQVFRLPKPNVATDPDFLIDATLI